MIFPQPRTASYFKGSLGLLSQNIPDRYNRGWSGSFRSDGRGGQGARGDLIAAAHTCINDWNKKNRDLTVDIHHMINGSDEPTKAVRIGSNRICSFVIEWLR
jgi:hypothetical protein